MIYNFTAKEIGFMCVIFQKELPLMINDPFETCSENQISQDWNIFINKFIDEGFITYDANHKPLIDKDLTDTMLCCLYADKVVSIVDNDEIKISFYINEEKKMLLYNTGSTYNLRLFNTDVEFINEFLYKVNIPHVKTQIYAESFKFEISAKEFEIMLEYYDNKEFEKIRVMCTVLNIEYSDFLRILKDIHLPDCKTILVEYISKIGTTLTKFIYTNNMVSLVKSTFSDVGDAVLLMKCTPINLFSNIIDFNGGVNIK